MIYILKRDLREFPYWKKGYMFYLENETGIVWGMKDKTTTNSYPLRNCLAGYVWLLISQKDLFRKVNQDKKRGE